MANSDSTTVPPRRSVTPFPGRRREPEPPHPLDSVIEILSELSLAVRSVSIEVRDGMEKVTDSVNSLGGRLDGQSRAMQDMTKEIRSFVDDKERLKGRVNMLEALEHDRQEANGKADAE